MCRDEWKRTVEEQETCDMNKTAAQQELSSEELQSLIMKRIERGELLSGEKLYSERNMAQLCGVSRMTVQHAYNALVKKGYLYKVRGAGTFVRKNAIDKLDLNYLSEKGNAGITAMVKQYGASVVSKVLLKGVITARYFADKLNLAEDAQIYVLHRIRYSNDEPIAVEYTYVPADLFPDIDQFDFTRVSLYDYMDSKGHMPRQFHEKMQIVEGNERECGYLEVEPQDPIYYLEFRGRDQTERLVEYTESYARCDRFEYKFTTNVQK